MRKTTYLCVMMLLSMNMMAQIDLNDSNWRRTFYDDFTVTGRSWHNWQSYPDKKWMGYPGSGVTTTGGFQVYQYSNCIFSPNDGTMKLVGEYCDTICRNTYPLPGWMHGNLDQFKYAVKKSITIAPQNTGVAVGNTDKVTFRVTDFMKATGPFEVQQGGEFTVIIQEECPD